jgi:RNA polymerase sigma-70 factor (ECF subfamily)
MGGALDTTTCDSLIEAARHGQGEDRFQAREQILRQLQDPWYRFCLGILRDAELAREATQESAYRLLRDLPKFKGQSSLKTWALGIALNVCREMRRRRPVAADPPERAGGDDPGRLAVDAETTSALRAVLEQLPPRQREAIFLRFFADLSVQETAEAMHCAEGTVKATVFQGLRWLKEKLKAHQ